MKQHDIHQQILNIAESLMQTRGYNAFSYRDIAELVGIKTSSIHYYFPAKTDLAKAVIKKHIEESSLELDQLINNKKLTCNKKLELFCDRIFAKTYLSDRKMCLGGMLASDVLTLPEDIQNEVCIFFNKLENWLKLLLTEGLERNEFCIEKKNIKNEAAHILSVLEGALLLARLYKEEGRLTAARRMIMERFKKE